MLITSIVFFCLFSISFMFCFYLCLLLDVWFCLPDSRLIFPSIYWHIYILLTTHSFSPPRFLIFVLRHHFTNQPDEECVQLLFSSHFSHPFGFHFRLFCLWNISQVWPYCRCADSGCCHCFLGEWQLSFLMSLPDVSIVSLLCLPEWQRWRVLKLWWSFSNI